MNNPKALEQFQREIYQNKNTDFSLIQLGLSLLKSGDFQQRWEVAKLFPKLGKQIIDPLLILLKDESIEVEYRWFIVRILSDFNDIKIIIAFTQLLQNTKEEELLNIVAEGLGKMGISAIKNLEKLLKEDESSRLLAVRALAQIRHSDVVEPLLQVTNDTNPQIRAIALECLGSFHQKQLVPIFIQALNDPVSAVRKEAIIALKMQPELTADIDIVQHLKPLLYDINLEICQQTALTIGGIKSDTAIEELAILLKKKTTPLAMKQEVIKALIWMELPQALTCLKQILFTQNLEICQIIINLLGTQKSEIVKHQASRILIEFLESSSPISKETKIKKSIAVSLGELGDKTAIIALKKLANDPNKSVQLHAISGLKKSES